MLGSHKLVPGGLGARQPLCGARRGPPRPRASATAEPPPAYAQGLPPFPQGPVALISDLDGTLAETELLKARSYALVATQLYQLSRAGAQATGAAAPAGPAPTDSLGFMDCEREPGSVFQSVLGSLASGEFDGAPGDAAAAAAAAGPEGERALTADEIVEICIQCYMEGIGGTTEGVARRVVDRLGLHEALAADAARLGVKEPWEALYRLHKTVGWPSFSTRRNIAGAAYEHNLATLWRAHAAGLPIAVATSSLTADAERALEYLGVASIVKAVVGKDKVKTPKPDPEVYLQAAAAIGVDPRFCVGVEDSLPGAQAAVAAGVAPILVANPFTAPGLRTQSLVPPGRVVLDASDGAAYERALEAACAELRRRRAGAS